MPDWVFNKDDNKCDFRRLFPYENIFIDQLINWKQSERERKTQEIL